MNQIASTVRPNPAAQATYERAYPIFNRLYEALEPIYDEIAAM